MDNDVLIVLLFFGFTTIICITLVLCMLIENSHEKWYISHYTDTGDSQ